MPRLSLNLKIDALFLRHNIGIITNMVVKTNKGIHANIDVHIRRLMYDSPEDRVKCISKLLSHCANMSFADKSRYDRFFQNVTHKGGESAMNSIKGLQNTQDLSVSVGKSYSEDKLMHIFFGKFHQGRKYTARIASHQAE